MSGPLEIVRGDADVCRFTLREDGSIADFAVPLANLTEIESKWSGTGFTPGTELYFKRWDDDEPGFYRVGLVEDVEEGWRKVNLEPLDSAHKQGG